MSDFEVNDSLSLILLSDNDVYSHSLYYEGLFADFIRKGDYNVRYFYESLIFFLDKSKNESRKRFLYSIVSIPRMIFERKGLRCPFKAKPEKEFVNR